MCTHKFYSLCCRFSLQSCLHEHLYTISSTFVTQTFSHVISATLPCEGFALRGKVIRVYIILRFKRVFRKASETFSGLVPARWNLLVGSVVPITMLHTVLPAYKQTTSPMVKGQGAVIRIAAYYELNFYFEKPVGCVLCCVVSRSLHVVQWPPSHQH